MDDALRTTTAGRAMPEQIKPPLCDSKKQPVWISGNPPKLYVRCGCGFEQTSRLWRLACNAAQRHAKREHKTDAEIVF